MSADVRYKQNQNSHICKICVHTLTKYDSRVKICKKKHHMNLHEGFENESLIINYSDLFSTNVNFSMLPTVKKFALDKTNEPVKLYSLLTFLNAATEDACEKLGLKYQKSSDKKNRVGQQKLQPVESWLL